MNRYHVVAAVAAVAALTAIQVSSCALRDAPSGPEARKRAQSETGRARESVYSAPVETGDLASETSQRSTQSADDEAQRRLNALGYVANGKPATNEPVLEGWRGRATDQLAAAPVPAGRAVGGHAFAGGAGQPTPRVMAELADEVDRDGRAPLDAIPNYAGEELWIIARDAGDIATADKRDAMPALRARRAGGEEIPLPLVNTDVDANITAYIASVHVVQQYFNPFTEKIEAVYVFPLPQNAAVSDFVMSIGDRNIRGIIRERAEAEEIYRDARAQGYVASLLTQERPNIFTQSVANIEAQEAIDVSITYFHTVAYRDGEYELVFPTVVGPRFNPPGTHNGIGAVPRGAGGTSGQTTEVEYLAPGERSGHDLTLRVDIDGGMPIEDITSPSHDIVRRDLSPNRSRVELAEHDRIPNKDFVLRYRLAGRGIKTALLHQSDEHGGTFTLLLQPPAQLSDTMRAPMELIFVLDCSGSMSGTPITLAKDAAERALRRLGPDDTFQVIRFSSNASALGAAPIVATSENIERGVRYLRSLTSEGGTMMIEGIKAALDFPHDPRRLRVVSFMTDGFIGNDPEILAEMQKRLGDTRVFSFGVGAAPNRYLLEHMAQLGNGAVAYVGLDEGAAGAVDGFYERVSHPAMTNLFVDWGEADVSDVYPRRIPDLFVGRPVVLTGRYRGALPKEVVVHGRVGGEERAMRVAVGAADADNRHAAITKLWARTKIDDLSHQTGGEAGEQRSVITTIALENGLMSDYTAFVAVDSSSDTGTTPPTRMGIPVPVPKGVSYGNTVAPDAHAAR